MCVFVCVCWVFGASVYVHACEYAVHAFMSVHAEARATWTCDPSTRR